MEAVTKNKAIILLNAIKAGGATRETLMETLGVNKAGLASQLSTLNARGLAMAEIDPAKAEFPILGEDKTYRIGTLEEYEAKKRAFGTAPAKAKTAQEVCDAAQKREDKASAAYSKAAEKVKDNPSDEIYAKVAELRKLELDLASMKLAKVQAGDFTYENVTVVDPAASEAKSKNKKAEKAPLL